MNGETEGKMRGFSRLEPLKWQGDGTDKSCPRHSNSLCVVVEDRCLSTVGSVMILENVIVYAVTLDAWWEFVFLADKGIGAADSNLGKLASTVRVKYKFSNTMGPLKCGML